jgi:hypothetical protein
MDIKPILKNQYHASLAMLEQAIEKCPADLWLAQDHPNPFWHVAYHALFFTHLYLQTDEPSFRPWEKHRDEYQFLGPLPWPPHRRPNVQEPYTNAEILQYLRTCRSMVEEAIEKLDLDAAESGFLWYKMSKLEHQIVSIRHLQHHAAQLADRLRLHAGVGVDWVGSRSA